MKLRRRLMRYLWIASAAIIILLAVMVSLARALLPYFDSYRSTVEARVSTYIGQPVAIERLDVRLLGLTPSVILSKVTLKSAPDGAPIARFEEIRLGLDLFSTLRERKPVLRDLAVRGAHIAVVRHNDGSFAVEGLVMVPQPGNGPKKSSSLGSWLLTQGRLAVRDSTLIWRDEMRKRRLSFEHVDIELVNDGERHRLNGSVELPEDGGKALKVAVDVRGNPLEGLAWDGAVYVKAEALRPAYWLPLLNAETRGLPLKAGQFSAEIWSEWTQGKAVRTEGSFQVRNAVLHKENRPDASVKEFSGELLWQRLAEGWDLDLQRLVLSTDGTDKRPSRLHLSHRDKTDLLLADRLKLDDLAVLAVHAPMLKEDQFQVLHGLDPRGEVRQLRIERRADGMFLSQGEFHAFGMNAWERLPGIDGATGHWRADNRGGEVYLASHAVHFDAPHLFRAPLQIDNLTAALSFRPMDTGWYLKVRNISASNADVTARGQLDMQFEAGSKPYLDLRLDFRDGQARQVPRYVPAKIMGESIVNWLDNAFTDGIARSGTVLFHGRTGNFPFYNNEGVFETRFQAEDIELNFAHDWPRLSKVSGEVLFENQGLTITPRSGTLFNTAIEKASVAIGDFKAPILEVNIAASPPAADVLRLLRDTPIAKHIGGALDKMEAGGRSDLTLSLRLPLSKTVAATSPLHYEGQIVLHDARLKVWEGVTFHQLDGTVGFSDYNFTSTALQGELLGAPVTLDIKTDAARTLVSAHGQFGAASLRQHVQLPLIEHLEGESDWSGLLYLPHGEGAHPSLEFNSSMAGMVVDLPTPIGKRAEERVPLSVRLAFGEDAAKRVSVSYGDRVSGRFAFAGADMLLTRGAVHFGPGATELPKEGWKIGGSLVNLDWSRWHELLPSGSGSAARLPLVIDMDRLSLVPMTKTDSSGASLRPENFPQLDLHIKNFSYDDWHLGELTGKSRSDSQHWEVPDLHFAGPHHTIDLSASWREGLRSRMEYSATSDNVEEMLRAFGFASVIGGGNGVISGNLEWDGVLSDISWARADGNLTVEMKDGALVDVNPGAGRLFGLLSLQALPRRLTLDFRDLFQKGMQFDEIKGTIRISGGNAYTNDLYIKSPSAGILVEGRTGLVKRDYDQTITVVPNVSESVSVASAIAWGPQVAAAVLLVQKLFKKNIAKATMIRYSVKGKWDDPKFTRIE